MAPIPDARRRRLTLESTPIAAAAYIAVSVIVTWPLVLGLPRDLPLDLGDPVFVCWALARASAFLVRFATGDAAFGDFWHAGIFHPHPWTGALSEHFLGHAALTLPVWLLSGNVVLCYNLHFLASGVLAALGMYLLVRSLTGDSTAGFIAGLCFGFGPYRVAAAAHLQVLSMQWMPWTLLAFRLFIVEGRRSALAAGVVTLWLQCLSSAYYMVLFPPVVAAWCGTCLLERRRLDRRVVLGLASGAIASLVLVLPFALPYLRARDVFTDLRRSPADAARFAADGAAWITASPSLNVWGWLQSFPGLENHLFPGLALPILFVAGVAFARRAGRGAPERRWAGFGLATVVLAAWLAMGPQPRLFGAPLGLPALFTPVSRLPGFDAVRATARFHVLTLLAGSIVGGLGAHALRSRPRLLAGVTVVALLDGVAVPFPLNVVWAPNLALAASPPPLVTPLQPPAVYRFLATLPATASIVHFPLGGVEHDLRYMFYSATLRAPMMNGYSGVFPPDWGDSMGALTWPMRDPDRAWTFMTNAGISHAVVHEDVWRDDTGARWAGVLEGHGARMVFQAGADRVYALPVASPAR